MEIIKTSENGVVTLKIDGRIDTTTAPVLEKEIIAAAKEKNAIELDLNTVEYISSAGLRVLLTSHNMMSSRGGMKITGINEDIEEIFEVTGFTDIFDIE